MERLPPDSFGRTLRGLIREVWKTQTAYASAVSLDTTWISKVIRGEQANLTYASLERLLAGLTCISDKERLYEAWREVYAPSPLEQDPPDSHSPGEMQIDYARSVHERISSGQILQTHHVLLGLWIDVVKTRGKDDVKIEVGHALVDTANQLDRIQLSLAVSAELCRTAMEAGEPVWMATALWVKGVGARLCRPRQIETAEGALRDLAVFTANWTPGTANGKAVQHTFQGICARELTLSGLDAVRSKMAGTGPTARESRRSAASTSSGIRPGAALATTTPTIRPISPQAVTSTMDRWALRTTTTQVARSR